MNISRGKVVLNQNGLIDGGHESNQHFYQKRTEGKQLPDEIEAPPEKNIPRIDVYAAPSTYIHQDPNPGFRTIAQLDKEKKQKELDKIEIETRILRIKEAKQKGELIPTDLVKPLFIQHTKSIVTAFHNAAESLISEFAKRKNLNLNEIAEIRKELISVVNTASENAKGESLKQVKNIQDEYSQKRERGERS